MHVWSVPPSRCAVFVSTQILHLSTHTERGLFLSRHSQIFCVFPNENVCQPSFLQSMLLSLRARLSHLQTVIDGQESRRALDKNVETPLISTGHELLHTTVGILAVGLRRNFVEDSMSWNRVTLRTKTERGSVARDVPFAYTTFLDTLLG